MNKPIYFNISIDVDTYATDYLTSSCNIEKMVISSYATGLDKLLTYLEKKNIKVTLFVIADHVKFNFVQDYLKNVIANGHEIASHSLSHRRNFSKLNLDELDDEIRKSKETIEDVLGIQVKGFRAPGYTITLKIWELLIKNGFTYDASLNNSLFYYAFKVLYKFFSTKGDFFVVQKLKEFPLDSSPFQVNKSYFNNSYSNVFWEIPFNYSKLISFPFLIFMLNQLPNYISKNMVKVAAASQKEIIQIQFHDYDLLTLEDIGSFSADIYFIKKYIKKSVEKRTVLYDSIITNLFSNRMPILLKDYVQMRSGNPA